MTLHSIRLSMRNVRRCASIWRTVTERWDASAVLGGERVFADFENNLMYVIKKNGGHVRLRLGSPDANSILNRMQPTKNAPPSISHPHSTRRMPIAAPMDLPGATPAQSAGEKLGYESGYGLRNPALRRRGRALHILDHIDKGSANRTDSCSRHDGRLSQRLDLKA